MEFSLPIAAEFGFMVAGQRRAWHLLQLPVDYRGLTAVPGKPEIMDEQTQFLN